MLTATTQEPPSRGRRAVQDRPAEHLDFERAPLTIAWEVTRATADAPQHWHVAERATREPEELDTEEGTRLIDRLAGFRTRPILVLTGGDPLMRHDLLSLAQHADQRGLRVSLTLRATALVTAERMTAARQAGVRRAVFSVDAAGAAGHDRFRGFGGSYRRTLAGMEAARQAGLPLQVNTTVCGDNVGELEAMVPMLAGWGVVQWSVFFLVPIGRDRQRTMLSAAEHERVLNWLLDLSAHAPFEIKTTAACHYRRIALQRVEWEAARGGVNDRDRPAIGVNDGRGFMFVSWRGDVMPSGLVPLRAGNVRERDPVDIYRNSRLFRRLRDPKALRGKCGRCEFREACGGSRARAYALSGDHLGSDPSCAYQPAAPLRAA